MGVSQELERSTRPIHRFLLHVKSQDFNHETPGRLSVPILASAGNIRRLPGTQTGDGWWFNYLGVSRALQLQALPRHSDHPQCVGIRSACPV